MQVIDKNGNIFGGGVEITGPDGKPKTSGGGGGESSYRTCRWTFVAILTQE
jgi:hypothetical protein